MIRPHYAIERSHARRSGVAALTAAILALTSLPAAFADDLDDKKDRVEKRIGMADERLDESSADLRAATDALILAQDDLRQAREHLATTQSELAAATALDARMQTKLETAILRLRKARTGLATGRAQVAEQEQQLRSLVVSTYEQGDPALMGLSMVFTTQDPAALAGNLNTQSTVLDVQSTILHQLEATEVMLRVKEDELESARQYVAASRRAAAENLRIKKALELRAGQAEANVEELVMLRQRARSVALKAKSADLAALKRLQAERDRIQQLILDQASSTTYTGAVDGDGVLGMPVDGSITSPFGWRTHPIWGYRSLHDGIDVGAGCGTPIRAAASGVVLSAYYSSVWGNRIIVDHGTRRGVGVSTIANHMSGYAVDVGERVERGEIIGYVGTTGWSTGCHLHWTVLQNGLAVDPKGWL
ncbi:peptidoglycan DD-metalloendopeptidase family protein [Nocardioides caldifontis]|uniref:peptidoglycan DD-metalloendopeptidase family protein n=1 Tax=Nocardioides caldifontis TaxID=2588938 RepID=UPI0011DF0B39|nr:peptidoglycan DD-metalloendopeptidase family protein [Nocardioides caldifontis]